MKTIVLYCFLFSFFLLQTSFKIDYRSNSILDSKELVNKLFDAISKIKTLRFTLKYDERMNGKMVKNTAKTKIQISPRKVFTFNGTAEVLWVQGQNNGDALVNPGTFPFVNLNLDPNGSIMRKNGHHTLHEAGFNHLADIIKGSIKKSPNKFNEYFVITGEEVFNGKSCHKLMIKYPEFAYTSYTVKKGETLVTIARKNYLSEHMILEKNKIGWYDDVKEGQVIQVPNGYSKLTVFLVDKELFLPVSSKIYDDLGLYETYDYYDLKVNPVIAPEEFTKTYKDYHF